MTEQHSLSEAIQRIQTMETCFVTLQTAIKENPTSVWEDSVLTHLLQRLTHYYESGQWLQDYELDEKGLLPPSLKRGVLSQDAVYDLLEQISS